MINMVVDVHPRSIAVRIVDDVDFALYSANPRFVADGVRVYMPRKHCGLAGRYAALCSVIMSTLQDMHVPASSLVDAHRSTAKRDRRAQWEKDAHEKMERLL